MGKIVILSHSLTIRKVIAIFKTWAIKVNLKGGYCDLLYTKDKVGLTHVEDKMWKLWLR